MARSLTDLIESVPEVRNWGVIASALLDIKNGNQLDALNISFSSFITQLASSRGRLESTYWRLVKAGEVYRSIKKALGSAGKELPELIDASMKATPESLEIVEKIGRVAPVEVVKATQHRAMGGTIPRSELRNLWETYRPVLSGRTARGRKVVPPRFDVKDTQMRLAQDKANRIAPVVQSDPNWLDVANPYSYRVMHIPSLKSRLSSLSTVAIIAKSAEDPVMLHGLYVGDAPPPTVLKNRDLDQEDPQFDYPAYGVDRIWYALTPEPIDEEFTWLPLEIGILEIKESDISVKRQALPLKPCASSRSRLLSDLLRETLRGKQPGKIE